MARRNDLPSTSARIFSRKPSRSARIFSALLLGLSLLVTLAGLGTAIYLERTRDSSAAPTPLLTAETPSAAAAAADRAARSRAGVARASGGAAATRGDKGRRTR